VTRNTLAVHNGDRTVKTPKCGVEQSGDAPTYFDFAGSLGGSEYLTSRRPPFKLIGLAQKEDE